MLPKDEARIKAPPRPGAAAIVAGDLSREPSNPLHDGIALRADVGKFPFLTAWLKVEIVASVFARDPEIGAGLFPLDAVRLNPDTRMPRKRDQVGEFVEKGLMNLVCPGFFGKGLKFGIQLNASGLVEGSTRSGAHALVPNDLDRVGKLFQSETGGMHGCLP